MRKIKSFLSSALSLALVVSTLQFSVPATTEVVEAASTGITSTGFLKASGTVLKNNYGSGATVYLRGTNAGSLTVQEPWMANTANSTNVNAQIDIINVLTSRFGADTARSMLNTYRDNYWVESDFDKCAAMGFNCIRVPLWYRDFVDANNNWYSDAFTYLDWFIENASERGMYVIIDMHGAYGSQNGSDHSGVDGGNAKEAASEFFFGSNASSNQEKYYQMWEKIAAHYAGNPAVAGYDLLNEPYCTYRYSSSYSEDYLHSLLWGIYNTAYSRIRAVDPDHVIIMEATWDEWDLPNPSDYGWTNVMYEYHQYEYSNYNNENNTQITSLQNKINNMKAMGYNVPRYLGEFNLFNNMDAWATGLQMLNDAGFSWTTWTYKCKSDNDNWGFYKHTANQANVETDSYDTIMSKWSASTLASSIENTSLINVVKNYTPGTVQTVNYASISSGTYYLKNDTSVVTAPDSGSSPLVANASSYSGNSEALEIVNNSDGSISFKSLANGKYICCVIDEDCQLLARSSAISDWEKFYLVATSDGKYGLLANANGKYVKADYNDSTSGKLLATSDSLAGSWEAFNIYTVGGQEVTTTTTQNSSSDGPEEVFGAVVTSPSNNTINVVWGSNTTMEAKGQNYNVYLDNSKVYNNVAVGSYTMTGVSAGTHTVKITSVYNNSESAGYTATVTVSGSDSSGTKDGFTDATADTWTDSGNWGVYFGTWSGTASGSYSGSGNPYKVYVSTNTNMAQWIAQVRYNTSCTSGHQYKVTVSLTADQACSVGIKEDISNEADNPVYTSIAAGATVELTGTYTMSSDTMRVMFEIGQGVPAGTTLTFNSISIEDLTQETTTTTTTTTTTARYYPESFDAYEKIEAEYFATNEGGVIDNNSSASNGKNIGGITNGVTMRYDNVNFSEAAGGLLIDYSSINGSGGNALVYVDSTDNLVGSISLTSFGDDWSTYQETSGQLTSNISAGTHTIYIKYETTDSAYFVANVDYFKFITAKTYIKTISGGIEINGYQISAKNAGFRTVYSVDSEINDQSVTESGLVYTVTYKGNTYTKTYASTSQGVMSSTVSDSDIATSYAMTMKFLANGNTDEYTASYTVKAYAKLADGTYVYTDAKSYTIYDVADNLYQNETDLSATLKTFLYDTILSKVNSAYVK